MDATISNFVGKMHAMQGNVIDMGKWLQLFAFGMDFGTYYRQLAKLIELDVIGEVTFSQPFGFMDAQQEDGIFDRIQKSVASGVWLGHVTWFYKLHNALMPVIGNHLQINAREGTVRDYTIREVQNRFERGSDRPDILGKLFEIHQEKPSEMDMTNITSVASSNVGAGSDITAISFRATIHFLLTNPEKKAKLVEEIDEVARSQGISGNFSFDQAREMPYLRAVMYESMRLYPAISMSLPRETTPEGFSIGDNFIPGGVRAFPIEFLRGPQLNVICRLSWEQTPGFYIGTRKSMEMMQKFFRPERWIEKKGGDLRKPTNFLCPLS